MPLQALIANAGVIFGRFLAASFSSVEIPELDAPGLESTIFPGWFVHLLAQRSLHLTARGVKIEDKAEIRKRLSRSPDTTVMASSEGAKAAAAELHRLRQAGRPMRANVGYLAIKDHWRESL